MTETGIFLVDGRPVVTGWGFAPDRPWETPAIAASAGVLHRPPDPVTRHDVAIPDIDLPELAAEPPPVPELPPQAPPLPVVEAAELMPPPVCYNRAVRCRQRRTQRTVTKIRPGAAAGTVVTAWFYPHSRR